MLLSGNLACKWITCGRVSMMRDQKIIFRCYLSCPESAHQYINMVDDAFKLVQVAKVDYKWSHVWIMLLKCSKWCCALGTFDASTFGKQRQQILNLLALRNNNLMIFNLAGFSKVAQ